MLVDSLKDIKKKKNSIHAFFESLDALESTESCFAGSTINHRH